MNASDTAVSSYDPSSWNSTYPIVITWIVMIALSLETLLGNAMVVLAYHLDRGISKQVNNRYIVSLAISDMVIGVEGFPLFTIYVLNGEKWPLGRIACETWLFLDYTLCLVSILTVLLITIDRYLSVCHTAAYIKWQSPDKVMVMIIGSWILPSIVFAFVIYGWTFFGDASSMSNGDCSVPFLTNPWVNMGMYVAYYWSTLLAMLILYKGIHKAAKKLEKKAKAKENRHIALILTQRLGTQVGMSLMLRSPCTSMGSPVVEEQRLDATMITKDSGYHTNMALSTTLCTASAVSEASSPRNEAVNNAVIIPPTNGPAPIIPVKSASADALERRTPTLSHRGVKRGASEKGRRIDANKPSLRRENAFDELSQLFEDASFSSIFHFRVPPVDSISWCSETNSSILMRHSTIRKNPPIEHCDTGLTTPDGLDFGTPLVEFKQWPGTGTSDLEEKSPGAETVDQPHTTSTWRRMAGGLVQAMRGRLVSTASKPSAVSRSSSTESSIDSPPPTGPPMRKEGRVAASTSIAEIGHKKSVRITGEDHGQADGGETRLSVTGYILSTDLRRNLSGPDRKISKMTSTRERIVSSVFSPLVAIKESRKRTRAEKRAHKAFRTITFIVGLFALLWSPYYVLATIYGFCSGQCIPGWLYTLTYYMCYLNSSGNPFAYALANRQFRVAFLRMLRGNFHSA